MKKLFRIVSYIGLVVVLAAFATEVANALRFTMSKPAGAESCNYSGRWDSLTAPFVAGRILAELPLPLPRGEPFTIKAFVYYNITSPYRLGSFVPMEMSGFIDDSVTSGGSSQDSVIPPPRVTFKFKGGVDGRQIVDYVSTADNQFTRLTGGYRSSSPSDIGTFSIERIR